VVDSNDRKRIGQARDELHRLLKHDELRNTNLLIYANKQDLSNAMKASEIIKKLGLVSLQNQEQGRWHVQMACATSGQGIREGWDWLLSEK
jgi:ADP-ribosylation factor 1/2